MVVDDNAAARYAIARDLQRLGYKTVEAASGTEALELAEFVSAVLLDVHLPDIHGFEVCRILRSQPKTRGAVVVHLTAVAASPEDEQQAEAVGANAYLVAPVEPDQLAAVVDGLLAVRTADTPGEGSGNGAHSILDQMTQRERLRNPGEPRS